METMTQGLGNVLKIVKRYPLLVLAGRFPCFGQGCMNKPILCHQQTQLKDGIMQGKFSGTYDLDSDCAGGNDSLSYYEVIWENKVNVGSWLFKHKPKTSKKYPWLLLYLRADATRGFSGGYHYDTRGMLKTVFKSAMNGMQSNGENNAVAHKELFLLWNDRKERCRNILLWMEQIWPEHILHLLICFQCHCSTHTIMWTHHFFYIFL